MICYYPLAKKTLALASLSVALEKSCSCALALQCSGSGQLASAKGFKFRNLLYSTATSCSQSCSNIIPFTTTCLERVFKITEKLINNTKRQNL